MTEAYADTRNTMRYFRSSDGKLGSHMPFNFQLIYAFEPNTNALRVKRGIDEWMDNMPSGFHPHWVVGSHDHKRVGSRVNPDIINVANAVVLMLPGASITYYVRS
jgi:alpha-glucosidase